MPNIAPISDLRNYGSILEQVKEGKPVYLTKNGRGAYVIYDIRDAEKVEEFNHAEAMRMLAIALNEGLLSAEKEGWIEEEDVIAHFRERKEAEE